MSDNKPIHAKPSLYAYYFFTLKEVAITYGYNLVVHGSLNRDLDLIAIPWQEEIKPHGEMIKELANVIGGRIMNTEKNIPHGFTVTHHGRMHYVINIFRGGYCPNDVYIEDPQYYLDISVMPEIPKLIQS